MKKLIGIAALGFVLSGCASTGGIDAGAISERAKQIQQITTTLCRFVPTVQTIASIINKGAGDALSVANDICAAVTTAPLAEGGTRKIVARGVVVRGKFVR